MSATSILIELPDHLWAKLDYYAAVWQRSRQEILAALVQGSSLSTIQITDTQVCQVLSSSTIENFPISWFESMARSERANMLVVAMELEKNGGEPWTF